MHARGKAVARHAFMHACMMVGGSRSYALRPLFFESLPLGDTWDDADNNKHQKPSHKHTNRQTEARTVA